jgi:hypothetical protein
MNRSTAFAATVAGFAFACPAPSFAQTAKDIAGTYRTASNINTSADGKRTEVFGPKGTGMAIFTPEGRFAVVNVNPDTPKFASNSRATGTAEENKAMVMGGIALFGTYTISDGVLVMNIEASTYPNWTGTRQTRTLSSITADQIKWTLPGSAGGTSEVVYQRMK